MVLAVILCTIFVLLTGQANAAQNITSGLVQCTAEQAVSNGQFMCLDGCDEDHVVFDSVPYCLAYFPDEGQCYLKPYTREDVMTCSGQVQSDDPPLWMVFIGGSNNYFMVKVILDMLLELSPDAGYDPKQYWNATGKHRFTTVII